MDKNLFIFPLLFFLILLIPVQAQTQVLITGKISYNNNENSIITKLPVRFAEVKIKVGFDTHLVETNENGEFFLKKEISRTESIGYTVFASTKASQVSPELKNAYSYVSDVFFIDPDNPSTWDLGEVTFQENDGQWAVLDYSYQAYEFLINNTGFIMSKIQIIWPCNLRCLYDEKISGYYPEINQIAIAINFKKNTVFHEYGHAMMDIAYQSNEKNFPLKCDIGFHIFVNESCPEFAFTEGWAEFMQSAIPNNEYFTTIDTSIVAKCHYFDETGAHLTDIEHNDWWTGDDCIPDNSGDIVEGAVASTFWDMYDDTESNPFHEKDDDNMHVPFQQIWSIIEKDNPTDINDFWFHWFSLNDSTPADFNHKSDMISIFLDHGIDNRLSTGQICERDSDCKLDQCEGSVNQPPRCCLINGTIDTEAKNYYCDENGDVKYEETCMDRDKDGFFDDRCNGKDCDDSRFDINPSAPEVCDGADNNCNGRIDEADCKCTNGQRIPCGTDEGICEHGEQICLDGQWEPCRWIVSPQPESCDDGLDNDCDGFVDENSCGKGECYDWSSAGQDYIERVRYGPYCANGYKWHMADVDGDGHQEIYMLVKEDYKIWADCKVTTGSGKSVLGFYNYDRTVSFPCDDGACNDPVEQMTYVDIFNAPTNQIIYPDVYCLANFQSWGWKGGVLKDPNGENYLVLNCGEDRDCSQGQYCNHLFNDPLQYYCQNWCGNNICESGEICPTDRQGPEDCNNRDDDCDGLIDEDLIRPCGLTNDGVCNIGTQACSAGIWVECSGKVDPSAEECNGLDDDCDGMVDNNLNPPLCEKQLGVCNGGKKTCHGLSGWLQCGSAEYGLEYQEKELSCDEKDNDCDGLVDEDRVCNRPPEITEFSPQLNPVIYIDQYQEFTLMASDPDKDLLKIEWTVNGTKAAEGNGFNLSPVQPGTYEIVSAVTDGFLSAEKRWLLQVIQKDTVYMNSLGDGEAIRTLEFDNDSKTIYLKVPKKARINEISLDLGSDEFSPALENLRVLLPYKDNAFLKGVLLLEIEGELYKDIVSSRYLVGYKKEKNLTFQGPEERAEKTRILKDSTVLSASLQASGMPILPHIYGSSSSENLTIDGNTVSLWGYHEYDTVRIVNGGILKVRTYDGVQGTGTINISANRIFIDSESRIEGAGSGLPGGEGGPSDCGGHGGRPGMEGGTEGGKGFEVQGFAGSGGGGGAGGGGYGHNGGPGGKGGGDRENGGSGGPERGDLDSYSILMGSGGGGGGGGGAGSDIGVCNVRGTAGAQGGNGGAAVILKAKEIIIDGKILMRGDRGGDGGRGGMTMASGHGGGGGGGGSGGGILLDGIDTRITGLLDIRGGLNGEGGFGASNGGYGGDGGGGRLKIFYTNPFEMNSSIQQGSGTVFEKRLGLYPSNVCFGAGVMEAAPACFANELNVSNSPIYVPLSGPDLSEYLKACEKDSQGYCEVPLKVSSDSAGMIGLSKIEIIYRIGPLHISENPLNDYLLDCTEDEDGLCSIPLEFSTESSGILNISDIRIFYTLDSDSDGINDMMDNCPEAVNPGQEDLDNDGLGEECDILTCGNNKLEETEECDDGNRENEDGCSQECRKELKTFVRGNVNGGEIDISDAIFMLNYQFADGPASECLDSADVNDDGKIDIADPIYLLAYLFGGGTEPNEPFPEADNDPTEDTLNC